MKLSVVIVSYNVRFFLEQCLLSVNRAIQDMDAEIFVVDNHSVDGSCQMVSREFPWVKLIENRENRGFSKANNQAIRKAAGEYILLLNPDTVLEEDSLRKCVDYMDRHPVAGALGARMIDGKGRFLPESKRGLPNPMVAFFKLSGFTRLFPKSKYFARYYLGHLDEYRTNDIEVLTGAFMMIRSKVLEKTGLLDEDYFMYGEDIDLSYRILMAGFRNVYFPETSIIHYKGESTKKSSFNYVLMFYRAMMIFARKHLPRRNARWIVFLIQIAIWFRASLSLIHRFIRRIYLPVSDAVIIAAGFLLITPLWEKIRFPAGGSYPDGFYLFIMPLFILIWLTSILFAGGYDPPVRQGRVALGVVSGSAAILVVYGLLPEYLRFSRMLVLGGSIWTLGSLLLFRLMLHNIPCFRFRLGTGKPRKILIAGSTAEAKRVHRLVSASRTTVELAGIISPNRESSLEYTGNLDELEEMVRVLDAEEVIFCIRDLSAATIIQKMGQLAHLGIDFKIAPSEGFSVVGSNTIHTSDEIYLMRFSTISSRASKRNKRVLDILVSVLFLGISPVLLLPAFRSLKIPWNIFLVIAGTKTWVGYHPAGKNQGNHLPPLREGVFFVLPAHLKDKKITAGANLIYARDYKLSTDLKVIRRVLKQRQP